MSAFTGCRPNKLGPLRGLFEKQWIAVYDCNKDLGAVGRPRAYHGDLPGRSAEHTQSHRKRTSTTGNQARNQKQVLSMSKEKMHPNSLKNLKPGKSTGRKIRYDEYMDKQSNIRVTAATKAKIKAKKTPFHDEYGGISLFVEMVCRGEVELPPNPLKKEK